MRAFKEELENSDLQTALFLQFWMTCRECSWYREFGLSSNGYKRWKRFRKCK